MILERTEAGGEPVIQRSAVIESDADQAKIEFATLDASGSPVGDPAVAQLGWTALRDHAQFAPGTATREKVTRETDLGLLGGGLVTEYFFADGEMR